MRVLHLIDLHDPGIGSSIRQTYQMARRQAAEGVETEFASAVQDPAAAGTTEILGFKVHRFLSRYPVRFRPAVSLKNRRVLGPLRELLARFRPDVVHAQLIHSHLSYASLALAKESGATVVFTAHDVMTFCYQKLTCFHGGEEHGGSLRDYRAYWQKCIPCQRLRFLPMRNTIIRRVLDASVDVRLCVSDELRRALEANDLTGFRTVHNAIEVDERPVDPRGVAELRRRFGLGDDPVVAISGRVHEQKGHLQLVKALARVVQSVPRARLLVLGKRADFDAYVKGLAQSLGVLDRIVVTDWLAGEELRHAYAAADVVATPSICLDTFGLVNLEAMNFRKPVVGTAFGGTPEVVEHGVTGYVENPFDVDAFAGRLAELLGSPARRAQMGEAGFRRLQERFRMERLAAEVLAIYRGAAGSGAPARGVAEARR